MDLAFPAHLPVFEVSPILIALLAVAHAPTVSTPLDPTLLTQQGLPIQEEITLFITDRTTRQVGTFHAALELAEFALLGGGVEEVGEVIVALVAVS